jgi:hypothetical protein
MNGSMWWLAEAEVINRRAPRSKGAQTRPLIGQAGRLGPTGPGPFWPGSAPACSPMLLGKLLT